MTLYGIAVQSFLYVDSFYNNWGNEMENLQTSIMNIVKSLISETDVTGQLEKEHLVQLLELEDFNPVYELADEIRRTTVGDEVHIRAIIEFSNICARQCKYCGLNCNHEGIDYYQMTADEILSTAEQAINAGYKTIVLQSGENPKLNKRWMGHVIKHICYGCCSTAHKNGVWRKFTVDMGFSSATRS